MKLLEVFRYELEHRLRRPSTWVYGVVLLWLAWENASEVYPLSAVNTNAPHRIAFDSIVTGMVGWVVLAGVFGDAALRDAEARMEPLLFTTPQRTIDHLGGRYLAALVVSALLLLFVPLGYALPTLMGYPDPAHFGPFRLAAVLEPWLILLVPNMALTGAVLFTVGVLSRRLIPVYLTGFASWLVYLGTAETEGIRFDPGGLGILYAIPRGEVTMTAAEQNSWLISSSVELMFNRLFWLAVTGGVLVFLHKQFRFAHVDGVGVLPERPTESDSKVVIPAPVTRGSRSFGLRTAARQALAIARTSLVEVTANVWFVGVLLACVIWIFFLLENIPGGPLGMSLWPVTPLVTTGLSLDYVAGIYILLAIFAGELLWKDRDVGAAEIMDAAPVTDGTAFVGRLLALIGVLALVMAASMVGGMLGQLGRGYFDLQPWVYIRVLFGLNFANAMLVAVLVLAVSVAVNHKYLGIGAALVAMALPFAGRVLPHHLLTYGSDPASWSGGYDGTRLTYSDMNGFGPFLTPFAWFKLYSAGWAILLGVAACVLWVRGREPGARARLRQARARFTIPLRRTAAVGVVVIGGAAGFILYNTNVLNALDAADQETSAAAAYEQRYSRFRDAPQPTVVRARLRVEIHPDDPAIELSGSLRLVNRTAGSIDSLHVTTNRDLDTRAITFGREVKAVVSDSALGYHVYALAQPLMPGDSIELSFESALRPRGFPNSGARTDVVENGTHFGRDWIPFVGYGPVGARIAEPRVVLETIIGTAADQIAVAPGVMRREWTENGRRYFHYETESAQSFDFAVISARYSVRSDRWNDPAAGSGRGVTLSVYHHPDHDRNVDTLVRDAKAALAYQSAQFGPYENTVLRIVEIPRYQRVARVHPTMVVFSEHAFFARTDAPPIDRLFFATAHEIAHHWWGALDARGSSGFLSGMLANYSAMMVTEKAYGLEAMPPVTWLHMNEYFEDRAERSGEVPLLDVQGQPSFRRGLLAMYLMREYLGEGAVNAALRRLLEKHRAGASSYATVRDVVEELRAVTPDSMRYLLTDLFETVTLWEVRTERAVVEAPATGEYRVTLDVTGRKLRSDAARKTTEVPMDDLVDIGVFASSGGALGKPLYLARHRIRSGKQTITVTVREKPTRAGVDPYHQLIDRYGLDNVQRIAGAPQ